MLGDRVYRLLGVRIGGVVEMPDRMGRMRLQQGQGMLEYALIILFIVLVVFGGLLVLGPAVAAIFGGVSPAL